MFKPSSVYNKKILKILYNKYYMFNPSMHNKQNSNSAFNFGISSRLHYDTNTIHDDEEQSSAPLKSMLDPNRVKNCRRCFSDNGSGPRPSYGGWGNSLAVSDPGNYPQGQLSDIESILRNLNLKNSSSRSGKMNPINVLDFELHDNPKCSRTLDPVSSLLSFPKQLNRSVSINRFYDLNINPQVNIYYDSAVNTKLEAKDNFVSRPPANFPNGFNGVMPTAKTVSTNFGEVPPHYNFGCNPSVFDIKTYPNMNKIINYDFDEEEKAIMTDSDDEL
jgi:hypothetical protein